MCPKKTMKTTLKSPKKIKLLELLLYNALLEVVKSKEVTNVEHRT